MSQPAKAPAAVCHFCRKPGWSNPRQPEFDRYGSGQQVVYVTNLGSEQGMERGEEFQTHVSCLKAQWEYCCPECGWVHK